MTISNSDIERLLRPYGVTLRSGVAEEITAYTSLLLKWNVTISLTAITDPLEILKFHFGESIFAASAVKFDESRLADVGSGAGFPGLPLAMVVPGLDVTLIESNSKKCAFLLEVLRELQLPNVTVFRGRMDDVSPWSQPFKFIAARAVGQHTNLLAWAKERIASRGKIVLWLGEADARVISRNSDWLWEPPKLIPGSERRFLLIGYRPESESPELFHVEHSQPSAKIVPRETSCAS